MTTPPQGRLRQEMLDLILGPDEPGADAEAFIAQLREIVGRHETPLDRQRDRYSFHRSDDLGPLLVRYRA